MIANAERVARELRVLIDRRRSTLSRRTIKEALQPLVCFALNRLQSRAPIAAKRNLTQSGWRTLAEHLNERLVFALGPTLRIEQIANRAVSLNSQGKSATTGIVLSEAVRAFPGLLETAAHLLTAWIDAQNEMLMRLKQDRTLLGKHFGISRPRARVTKIRPGLSDSHDVARSVTLLEFAGNRRVIYKPRSCDGEELWYSALRWLNQNEVGPRFRIPFRLARKNYYWTEFLRASACRSLAEVRSFYLRWGAQVALAQILGASDLHWENWLAVGAQPILLDAELIAEGRSPPLRNKVTNRHSLSPLLQTGLFVLNRRDRAGVYKGIAPLDAALPKDRSLNCWPRYNDVLQPPWKYAIELVSGFEAAAEIFRKRDLRQRFFEEIICRAQVGPNRRVLFRASAHYMRLLRESLEPPRMLSHGKRWPWLARKCCASSITRPIGVAEARALLRCDLPRFMRRRTTFPISWKQLLARSAQLRGASSVLRRRVLLGSSRDRH